MNFLNKTFITFNNRIILRSLSHGQLKIDPDTKWSNVINEAEKAVGYPNSYLSLRWIINDEVSNVTSYIRRLIGTNHPLLKTARDLLLKVDGPSFGLIVLLISKTAGLNTNFTELECDKTADILHSQRIIAEVIEMMRTGQVIHRNLMKIDKNAPNASDLHFGNKLALLCGDYLFASVFSEIAKLRNSQIQTIVACTLRDFSEGGGLEPQDMQHHPIPSKPHPCQKSIEVPLNFTGEPLNFKNVAGHMKSEWMYRTIVDSGNLLSSFTKASLLLGNHSEKMQNLGFELARNYALACQASIDRDSFNEDCFSLVSAPVMLYLEDKPEFYKEIMRCIDDIYKLDYDYLRSEILNGKGLEKTIEMQEKFVRNALQILDHFKDNDSKHALINILQSL